jgi:hypothetical protein
MARRFGSSSPLCCGHNVIEVFGSFSFSFSFSFFFLTDRWKEPDESVLCIPLVGDVDALKLQDRRRAKERGLRIFIQQGLWAESNRYR